MVSKQNIEHRTLGKSWQLYLQILPAFALWVLTQPHFRWAWTTGTAMNRQCRQTWVCPGACPWVRDHSSYNVPRTINLQLLRWITSTSTDIILGRLAVVVVRNISYHIRLLGQISTLPLITCANPGQATYPSESNSSFVKWKKWKHLSHRVTVRIKWESTVHMYRA